MSTSQEGDDVPTTSSGGQGSDEIFALFKANKVSEAIAYVKEGRLATIDCVDHHGTTALQYAAFRGLYEVCDLLIKKGADVNAKTHDQGYSALMFAAIGNHKRVVSLLLENEADVDYTNMIGRTAAQMAAFVNSNESVDLINSYISKESLGYFTETHSIYEKEAKLPKGKCLDQLHRLLISSNNYSPVFVIKSIVKNNETVGCGDIYPITLAGKNEHVLIDNMDRVIQTLDAFSTKVFKVQDTECPNDLLAFKLHYYKYLFEYVRSHKKLLIKKLEKDKEATEQDEKFVNRLIESSIKPLLAEEPLPETARKYKVYEEKFLRESIRQFPYRECALVRQMATILAQTQIGQHPSALYVITSCLNGQRLNSKFDDDQVEDSSQVRIKPLECRTCTFKSIEVKLCTHCRQVAYCDKFCQKLDWPMHKSQKNEAEKTKD